MHSLLVDFSLLAPTDRRPCQGPLHAKRLAEDLRAGARASVLPDRQALLEHHARSRPQFFALALELPAGGQNVAPTRRAHGARVARVEHDFREALDRLPVRAFERASGPGVERNEV